MEKRSEMSVRQSISIVAGEFDGNRKSWLARIPRRVSTVSLRMVKALWYGEIDDPMHWAARDIRRKADELEAAKRGQAEALALKAQYESIIGGLNARDPDFYRPDVAALLIALSALSRSDSPGTS